MKIVFALLLVMIPCQIIVSAGWASTPPVINGYLDDSIWSHAGVSTALLKDFNDVNSSYNMTLYLLNDNEYLYIGIRINDTSFIRGSDYVDICMATSTPGSGEADNVIRMKNTAEDTNTQNNPETAQDANGIIINLNGPSIEVRVKLSGTDPDDLHYKIPTDEFLRLSIRYYKQSGEVYYYPRRNEFQPFYLAAPPTSPYEGIAFIVAIFGMLIGGIAITLYLLRRHTNRELMPKKSRTKKRRRRISPH